MLFVSHRFVLTQSPPPPPRVFSQLSANHHLFCFPSSLHGPMAAANMILPSGPLSTSQRTVIARICDFLAVCSIDRHERGPGQVCRETQWLHMSWHTSVATLNRPIVAALPTKTHPPTQAAGLESPHAEALAGLARTTACIYFRFSDHHLIVQPTQLGQSGFRRRGSLHLSRALSRACTPLESSQLLYRKRSPWHTN
ncbi:hypothetical protein CONLIGDRAFT_15032 [Coniochaeta ligniaria NRRL 30616]|uniref:Uncharacterized protein n=1 Tax=Coniochaeta ligniaria NRRL 30616 TaxID=1408157 RepID=A0A1J7JX62_9PEZI|nr:hypothetical protein CONLIGDRAFT_15032 [Coniochaeta ligniaria NRRL 30616]